MLLFIVGLSAGLSTCTGAASYDLGQELKISDNTYNTAVSLLLVGTGVFAYILAPSPRIFGRRLPYLVCVLSGLLGSIMFGKVQDTGLLIIAHVFLGVTESCAETMVQLSLADIFFQHQRGSVIGLYVFAISGGTFLGPLIGGFIAADPALRWRWVGWVAAICSAVILLLALFTMEETKYHRCSLAAQGREAQDGELGLELTSSKQGDRSEDEFRPEPSRSKNQDQDQDDRLESKSPYGRRMALVTTSERNTTSSAFGDYVYFLRLMPRCFVFPAVLFGGFQWGLQSSLLNFYLTVENINYYGPPWNYDNVQVGVMNVPCIIGTTLGIIYGGVFGDRFVRWKAARNGGILEAEYYLWLIFPTAFVGSAGLLLFGIGSDRVWNWPITYFGLGCIGFTWGSAGDISLTYMQQSYPEAILECMVGVAVITNAASVATSFAAGMCFPPPVMTETDLSCG